MKPDKKTAAAAGAGLLAAGFVFLLAPGRSRAAQCAPFRGRYIAHRGLHGEGRPENSLAAFRAAAEARYGAELDARLTRDGAVVVMHDPDTARMTGVSHVVAETDLAELRTLRLGGTGEGIPTLREALTVLTKAGVPVILEVKDVAVRRAELCSKVLEEIDRAGGDICIESFDPRIVAWFRFHAPDLLRGQLTAQSTELKQGPLTDFLLSRVLLNFLGRPQFIAHRTGRRSLPVLLASLLGAMRVTWTAVDREQESRSDAVIFEDFLPPVVFR